MMRLLLLTSLFLAACNTTRTPEPIVRTVTVNVPVATHCVPDGTPTSQPARAALGVHGETGDLIQQITAELMQRRAYDDQVEPVVRSCRG